MWHLSRDDVVVLNSEMFDIACVNWSCLVGAVLENLRFIARVAASQYLANQVASLPPPAPVVNTNVSELDELD